MRTLMPQATLPRVPLPNVALRALAPSRAGSGRRGSGARMLALSGAVLLTAGLGWGLLHGPGRMTRAVAEADGIVAAPRAGAGYLDGRPVPINDGTVLRPGAARL